MTEQSHTPGPWEKVRGELRGSNGEKVVEYGSGLAIMCGGNPDPEHVANARLIAAAPELLEALNGLLSIVAESNGVAGYHLNGNVAEWDEFEELNVTRAAIAKATGAAS